MMSGPTPAAGATRFVEQTLGLDLAEYITVPTTLFVLPGETSVTFDVTNDAYLNLAGGYLEYQVNYTAGDETFSLDWFIFAEAVAITSVTTDTPEVQQGDDITVTVNVASPAPFDIPLTLFVQSTGAPLLGDLPSQIVMPAGQSTTSFTLQTVLASGFFVSPAPRPIADLIITYGESRNTLQTVDSDPARTIHPITIQTLAAPYWSTNLTRLAVAGYELPIRLEANMPLLEDVSFLITSDSPLLTAPALVTASPSPSSSQRGWADFVVTVNDAEALNQSTVTTSVNLTALRVDGKFASSTAVTVYTLGIQSLTFDRTTIARGESVVGTITLNRLAPQDVVVTLDSGFTADQVSHPQQITIPAGQDTAPFTLDTVESTSGTLFDVTVDAYIEEPSASASATIGLSGQQIVTDFTLSADTIRINETVVGTVSILTPAPVGGQDINIRALNNQRHGTELPFTITIPEGQSSGTFEITKAINTSGNIALEVAIAGTAFGNQEILISERLPIIVTFDPPTIMMGETTTVTLSLSEPAPLGGLALQTEVFTLSSLVELSNDVVFIPEGAMTGTFTATALVRNQQFNQIDPTFSPAIGVYYGQSTDTDYRFDAAINRADLQITIQPLLQLIDPSGDFGFSELPSVLDASQGVVSVLARTNQEVATGDSINYILTTDRPDLIQIPSSISLVDMPNSSSANMMFDIVVNLSAFTTSGETVTITAIHEETGYSRTFEYSLINTIVEDFTITPEIVTSGDAAIATVTLSTPAPSSGAIVSIGWIRPSNLVANPNMPIVFPETVTIPAGQTSTTFEIDTVTG